MFPNLDGNIFPKCNNKIVVQKRNIVVPIG